MDRRFLVQQDEDRYVAIAPIDLHKETPSAVQAESSAQRLPIELVILIITHVRERSDYLSLCNTSKTLRTIVEPLLYRIVDVTFISPSGPDSLDISRFTGLCSTLSRNTHISCFVTELRINLVNWRICRKFIGGDIESEPLLKPCTCDEVDAQVGDAVTSLLSLERLYVYCFLCENKSGRHRHLSFTGLSVKLTAFYLRCNCEDGCEPALAQLISAKSINSASALSIQWRRSFVNRTLGDSVLGRLAEPEYLSNLKTFVHDDSIFADMLVIRRRITRLGFKYTPTLSLQMIDKSHTTHLLIPDGLAYLKKQLRRWPDAFLNLRCIGTLYIRAYEGSEIMAFMQPLMHLKHLETIEIVDGLSQSRLGVPLLTLFEAQHPTLRRVVLPRPADITFSTPTATLWEKGYTWTARIVPYLGYWDLLTDWYERM